MNWDIIIEKLIRKAQEEGKFDNLQGKGRPLNLDENPFEDPAWQMANRLLKDNGFRPDWLEEDVALREKLARARQSLRRTHDWRAAELAELGERNDAEALRRRTLAAAEWARALARFHDSIAEVNAAITRLNLKVPHVRFQRMKRVAEDEVKKVLEANSQP